MKILIVTFADDNFGDNLIRICFERILKVVLGNLQIDEYDIDTMALKKLRKKRLRMQNWCFLPGEGCLA